MATLRSISLRLTVWFSSVFLIGLILFGVSMWLDLAYSLHAGRQRTLMHRAERLEELLKISNHQTASERVSKFREFEEGTPEGSLIQVFDGQGGRIYPAAGETAVGFPWPRGEVEERRWSQTAFLGQPYLVLRRPVEIDGKRLTIFVAGQLSDNRGLIWRFQIGLLATIPVLFLLSSAGGYLLSRRALKPVDRMIVSTRNFSVNNLSGRLPVVRTGDELERLAQTCNDMLARLEGAVTQMKRFTADASHELRSPISYIRTVAECARMNSEADAESHSAFGEIIAETDQAGRLLEDMLALARADAGEANLLLTEVDLSEVLREACLKIKPQAEARRQTVSLRMQEDQRMDIRADPDSVRRLLWILLDNAVKYTPEEGRIAIEAESDSSQVTVRVKDSGIGIAGAELPYIFDRFYRVDSSRSQVTGTGLGLAIAKWIAEKHQASLTVSSRERAGSVFQLVFPVAG
jgi:heavy metal sensor kinase